MNEKDIVLRLEDIEKRLLILEQRDLNNPIEFERDKSFTFLDKTKDHNILLEELLKSDFCHSKNGLTIDEIISVFRESMRPVVPKKINDLLHIWKMRKKIEAIKEPGSKQHRYFWVKNASKTSAN